MTPLITETLYPFTEAEMQDLKIIEPSAKNQIAVVIDNFLRDKLLLNLLNSIFTYSSGVKIYIADQSIFNNNTDLLYKKLINKGHEIVYCGFDCGISVARNRAIDKVTEPYVFVTDCDGLFNKNTDLKEMSMILKNNKSMGFLSMYEFIDNKNKFYEINLVRNEDKLNYMEISDDAPERKNDFFYCDYTMNVGMAKREIFSEVKYDEMMKLAEHLDFFMQLKYNTNWKVACATQIHIENQNITINNDNYKNFRGRNKTYWEFYIKKWNLNQINDYFLPTHQTINSKPQTYPNSVTSDNIAEKELKEFTDILDIYSVDYYLVKETCLQYVRHDPLGKEIFISAKLGQNVIDHLIKKEYKYSFANKTFIKNGITIIIETYVPKNFKMHYPLNNKVYKVPCPVVKYLEQLYGPDWENPCQK